MSNINDESVYDDNYTVLSKIRKIMRQVKDLITRVTNLENAGGYTLPIASSSRLGGIKVGNNLTIREDGTLDAQAGGGGGDVSGKLDTLYGQLYNKETSQFDRVSLNNVQWNKDLIQTPDTNGQGSGDRRMQIPSMWALNQVYAEALNKGGGSTLQGNLAKVKGLFSLASTASSKPFIPANMSGAGHSFPFVDIYQIRAVMADSFDIQLENVSDSTDTITLTIPENITFPIRNGCIRLYDSSEFVSDAAENPSYTYSGYIEMYFQTTEGSDTNRWAIFGQGTIDFGWDTTTGYKTIGAVNIIVDRAQNYTTYKSYVPSQRGDSYYEQIGDIGTVLDWYGYYVH